MLSIAIIMMISGLTVTLIIAIKDSFMTVYNSNDSTDYAYLYSRAFEQSLLNKVMYEQTDGASSYIYVVSGNRLRVNTNRVFEPSQGTVNVNGTVKEKWDIYMGYKWDSSKNIVSYKIYVYDAYYNPGKLTYTYKGSVLLPHFSAQIGTIEVGGDPAISSDKAGYVDEDATYMRTLTFTPA